MVAIGLSDNPEDLPIAVVTQHGVHALSLEAAKVIAQNILLLVDLFEKEQKEESE